MRTLSTSLAVIAALAFGPCAQAATVWALQGQVLVSAGQGYRLVDGSAQLEPGGTVVANPGAVAQVTYAGGCKVTVQPGSVYLIAPQGPCKTGGPTQTGGLTDTKSASASGGVNPWLIGGAAVAVGGGAAYLVMSISP